MLILAGDLASTKQSEVASSLKFFRELAKDRPILLVIGNHDLWSKEKTPITRILEKHKEIYEKYKISYLPDSPVVIDNVLFVGWDGWYANFPYESKDFKWIAGFTENLPTDAWLRNRNVDQITTALKALENHPDKKRVAITHFPCVAELGLSEFCGPNLSFHLRGMTDILCMGHSHQRVEGMVAAGLTLYNAGSDYDKPRSILFEVC